MLSKFLSGVCAGLMIAIGGTVYLSCENKYVGAALFSVALFCICLKGYSLFTGKIGFIPESHTKEDLSVLFLGLIGNAVSTVLLGFAVSFALPALGPAAAAICDPPERSGTDHSARAGSAPDLYPGLLLRGAHVPCGEHLSGEKQRTRHFSLHTHLYSERL